MKKNTLLKVTSILMIIGGFLSLLLAILTIVVNSEDRSLVVNAGISVATYDTFVVTLFVTAIIELIAGFLGVGTANKGKAAMPCIIMAVIILVFAIASCVLSLMLDQELKPTQFVSFILPVLYLIGGIIQKKYEVQGQVTQQ